MKKNIIIIALGITAATAVAGMLAWSETAIQKPQIAAGDVPANGDCPCCSKRGAQGENGPEAKLTAAKKAVADYYVKKYGETVFDVEVQDYGCHMEATVIRGGKVIKRFSINGDRIEEIG